MTEPYLIRTYSGLDPALSAYRNLIFTSFTKSLRYGNDWFKEIESSAYFKTYSVYFAKLLERPNVLVRLAVLSDDEDTCIGWSIYEGHVLHYVYVKGEIEARKKGIATKLVPNGIQAFTHLTKMGKAAWKSKHKDWIFNPFL